MTRYVAMLRGINVGGKHKVPMVKLAEVFRDSGCADVATLIQSGNVVFSAQGAPAPLQKTLAAAIEKEFGFAVPTVVRSLPQMSKVVQENPFFKRGLPEKDLHVMFLHDVPTAGAVSALDREIGGGKNTFEVVAGEVFLYLPDGVARTKLTNQYFDSRLKTVSTQRNWATTRKLLAMLEAG